MPGKLQRFNGRPARSRSVAMGHHENWNIRLLLALVRHARADLFDKPTLELLTCFDSTASHDQSVGVEGIYHLIEEESQGMCLNPENVPAKRID